MKYSQEALTVLHPYMDVHWLWEASQRVRKNSAVGVDNESYADYERNKQDVTVKANCGKSAPLFSNKLLECS